MSSVVVYPYELSKEFIDNFDSFDNIEVVILENVFINPNSIFDGIPIDELDEEELNEIKSEFLSDVRVKIPTKDELINKIIDITTINKRAGYLLTDEMSKNNSFNLVMNQGVINSYFDSIGLNRPIMDKRSYYDIRCVMMTTDNDKTYLGHAWVFTHPDYFNLCGMYGIKSSVMASLSNDPKWRGVARTILREIIRYAKSLNKEIIVVPWPLEKMKNILLRFGFEEYNSYDENNRSRRFMKNMSETSEWMEGYIVDVEKLL